MSVSIQVVDNAYGRPAVSVVVSIARVVPGGWAEQAHELTDRDGFVPGLSEVLAGGGIYRFEFDLDRYFSSLGVESLYSAVSIRTRIADAGQFHHILLFITPHSCATYCADWDEEVQ